MKFAYTIAPGRGETNLLLADVAGVMAQAGLTVCGTVQIDTDREKVHHCDMDVQVLPNGPLIRISQSLGKLSRGCRLNTDALEQAVALTEQGLVVGADILLINKFGKHEAEGRGFRNSIADALSRDIPVLVGVNKLNVDAFQEFCGGEAIALEPDPRTVLSWCADVTGSKGLEQTVSPLFNQPPFTTENA